MGICLKYIHNLGKVCDKDKQHRSELAIGEKGRYDYFEVW